MKPPLWKISITTNSEAENAVAELLQHHFGTAASSYTDVETGETTAAVYLARKVSSPECRAELRDGLSRIKSCGLDICPGKISLKKIRRLDWAESWKHHFKPIEIGDALLIKPSWSKKQPRKNQAVMVLDPGLSFGTGQHPTTRFCLEWLAKRNSKLRVSGSDAQQQTHPGRSKFEPRNPKLSFLDIGTGSGILAIAAAKLGCAPVEAFDFDAEAVRIARENAQRNHVGDKIHFRRANLTRLPKRTAKRFDVICANLASDLLISQRARILNRLKRGGMLVTAGILKSEFSNVRRTFEAGGLQFVSSRTENEWRSGAFIF